jgi:diketogulonate reductase-like aldo/keto reductase
MAESGVPRNRIWITTKLWPSNRGRAGVIQALDESLRRLNLSYVDLYLIHSPNDVKKRVEQWKAMEGNTYFLKSTPGYSRGMFLNRIEGNW